MSEDLIIRFFKGQCDRKEAKTILQYLEENKEAAEKYLGRKEWDEIESPDSLSSEERSQQMFANIRSQTYERPKYKIANYKWAIAASLIMVMAAGLVIFNTRSNNQSQIALSRKDTRWRSKTNFSDITKNYILSDGTSVILEPQSTISYQFPFPADKREVKLNGKGFFKVAGDKKRPFTVFSGKISTTALGTEFTINAFADKKIVSVKLHEGKVMIKRLEGSELFYLLPAQELTYDKATGSIEINRFGGAEQSTLSQTKHLKRQTGVSISFEREPLKNVFDQLEKAYHIDLKYPEDGFKDYYFTGNFNKTDSLERVLRIIAQTNELEVMKTTSSYQIIKKR